MKRLAVMVAAMFAVAAPAGAATLSLASGNVLANTGNGFVRATEGQQLSPGTRIMIGTGGGNATIAYDLSCLERITAGQVVTVKLGSPCAADLGQSTDGTGNPGNTGGGGGPGTGGPVTANIVSGIPNAALVGGGVAVAAGVGIGIYQLSKPSSP